MKSPTAPGHVWHEGMNAKKRGWSARFMYGSTSRSSRPSTSANAVGASGGGPPTRAVMSAGEARCSAGIDGSESRATSMSTAAYPTARISSGVIASPPTAAAPRGSNRRKPLLHEVMPRGQRAAVARDRGQELVAVERHEVDVGARHDRRRARHLAQQGDLAEAVAGGLPAPEAAALGHLDLARRDHVEALAGLALADDRRPRRERLVAGVPCEVLQGDDRQ